jgi:hypothetical protein
MGLVGQWDGACAPGVKTFRGRSRRDFNHRSRNTSANEERSPHDRSQPEEGRRLRGRAFHDPAKILPRHESSRSVMDPTAPGEAHPRCFHDVLQPIGSPAVARDGEHPMGADEENRQDHAMESTRPSALRLQRNEGVEAQSWHQSEQPAVEGSGDASRNPEAPSHGLAQTWPEKA